MAILVRSGSVDRATVTYLETGHLLERRWISRRLACASDYVPPYWGDEAPHITVHVTLRWELPLSGFSTEDARIAQYYTDNPRSRIMRMKPAGKALERLQQMKRDRDVIWEGK